MANQQDIKHIIDSTDITALVSKYVKLEKQGKNYKGLCPFHSEDTPSFVVSPEKKVAHCFGCGGGGNPINFLMQIENLPYIDAVKKLADFNGIEFKGYVEDKKTNSLSKYYKIMQTATNFYKKYLLNTKDGLEAINYLNKRGIDEETIKMFGIGLSPHSGDTIYKVLKDSNYLELDMTDVGLIDKNKVGYYDLFFDRIMFPIFDEMGNPIAFSGRIYYDAEKNISKYVNTRDTVIFNKGDVLFNLHLAKGEILKKKRFILHEGQMDVIASYKSGLKEAVCTLGTALTYNQAKTLQKYANHAIICYDGDSAGIKASKKAINIFKSLGFKIHLVLLPDGMDPDEFTSKNGQDAYVDYFENNMIDSTQYLYEVAVNNKNFNDSTVVEAVKHEVFDLLFSSSSKTEQEDYLLKLSQAISSSYEALYKDFEYYCNTHRVSNDVDYYPIDDNISYPIDNKVSTPKKIKGKKWNKCEIRLFMYARSSKEEALYIDNILMDRMDALTEESQRLWIALINEYYVNYNVFDEGIFIKMLSQEDVDYYLEILEALRFDVEPYSESDRNECLLKLKELKYDARIKQYKEILNNTSDPTEKSRIIDKTIELKRKKNQLIKARRK